MAGQRFGALRMHRYAVQPQLGGGELQKFGFLPHRLHQMQPYSRKGQFQRQAGHPRPAANIDDGQRDGFRVGGDGRVGFGVRRRFEVGGIGVGGVRAGCGVRRRFEVGGVGVGRAGCGVRRQLGVGDGVGLAQLGGGQADGQGVEEVAGLHFFAAGDGGEVDPPVSLGQQAVVGGELRQLLRRQGQAQSGGANFQLLHLL